MKIDVKDRETTFCLEPADGGAELVFDSPEHEMIIDLSWEEYADLVSTLLKFREVHLKQ